VKQLMDRPPRSLLLATALTLVLTPRVSHAQARVDCSRRISPGVGFSVGRSLAPYLGLSQGAVDGGSEGSVLPGGGLYLAGRLDLPIAGPWRGRVEVSGANWPLELRRYSNDGEVIARDTVGQIGARQIVASIGRQGGRGSSCGYVLAGGGLYSFAIERTTVRRRGVAITAGIEFPVAGRGAVQLEGQIHMISLAGHPPVSEGAMGLNISVGWSHRF
jgi:hypothetical protein